MAEDIELVLDADGLVVNAIIPDPEGKWTPPEGHASLRNPPPGVGIGHKRVAGRWERPALPTEAEGRAP